MRPDSTTKPPEMAIVTFERAEAHLQSNAVEILRCLRAIVYAWDYGNDNLEKALRAEIDDAKKVLTRLAEGARDE